LAEDKTLIDPSSDEEGEIEDRRFTIVSKVTLLAPDQATAIFTVRDLLDDCLNEGVVDSIVSVEVIR
jgi:hypothetical protein